MQECLSGLPHPVGEGEHLHVAEHTRLLARRVGGLPDDHRTVWDADVGRPPEDPADDLALEAGHVELALAGHDELGAFERGIESGRLGHDLEAGSSRAPSAAAHRRDPRRATSLELGNVDASRCRYTPAAARVAG